MHNNFKSSAFISGIVLLMIYVNLKDATLFVMLFVITQLFAGLVAFLLIILRLFRVKRINGSFMYSLSGTIHMALLITDILLLFDHSLLRRTILVFTVLNAFLGICILTDIRKRNKVARRNISEL